MRFEKYHKYYLGLSTYRKCAIVRNSGHSKLLSIGFAKICQDPTSEWLITCNLFELAIEVDIADICPELYTGTFSLEEAEVRRESTSGLKVFCERVRWA